MDFILNQVEPYSNRSPDAGGGEEGKLLQTDAACGGGLRGVEVLGVEEGCSTRGENPLKVVKTRIGSV